jgi:hypothetical protein
MLLFPADMLGDIAKKGKLDKIHCYLCWFFIWI